MVINPMCYFSPPDAILAHELKRVFYYHMRPDRVIKFYYHDKPYDIHYNDNYDEKLEEILLSCGATL